MSLPYDEMKTPFKSKVSKAEQWARDETKTTGYSQSGYSITVPERSLSELVTLRDDLTESNRQLRESVEAVEMENKRLSKENDQLREELEKSKEQSALWKIENESRAILIGKYHKIIGYDNSDGFHSEPSPEQMLISLKTALAAAKEALEQVKLLSIGDVAKQTCNNALALITECEKET